MPIEVIRGRRPRATNDVVSCAIHSRSRPAAVACGVIISHNAHDRSATNARAAVLAVGIVALACDLAAPRIGAYPAAALGPIAFIALGLVYGRWFSDLELLLTPQTWGLAVFFVATVIVPMAITWVGPVRGALPYLPPDDAINGSMVLTVIAFIAFLAGSIRFLHGTPISSGQPLRLPRGLPTTFMLIGALGAILTFSSFAKLAEYYRNPALQLAQIGETTLRSALSLVLRPFAIFGAVALWNNAVARPLGKGRSRFYLTATALTILLVGTTFNFNRASFAVPLVAFLGTYTRWVRRISVIPLLTLGAVFAIALLAIGSFRSAGVDATAVIDDPLLQQYLVSRVRLPEQVQIYGGGPQFPAFLIKADQLQLLNDDNTLLGSFLYPVPKLGGPFRPHSGPVVYNRLVYGTDTILDQLVPFIGELYVNLGIIGVLMVFTILGAGMGTLQREFCAARSPFASFCILYAAIWASYLASGSLSAVVQEFVYFCWPAYVWVAWQLFRSKQIVT